MTITIEIYDPPMCCATGACGPQPDPELLRFANDLRWCGEQGIAAKRYGLTDHPQRFAETPAVRQALTEAGNDCLPLVLVDGVEVHRGSYPSRAQLQHWAGVADAQPAAADDLDDAAINELTAIAASMSAHCQPCLDYHVQRAQELGVSVSDIETAIAIGMKVEQGAAAAMQQQVQTEIDADAQAAACCGGAGSGCC